MSASNWVEHFEEHLGDRFPSARLSILKKLPGYHLELFAGKKAYRDETVKWGPIYYLRGSQSLLSRIGFDKAKTPLYFNVVKIQNIVVSSGMCPVDGARALERLA